MPRVKNSFEKNMNISFPDLEPVLRTFEKNPDPDSALKKNWILIRPMINIYTNHFSNEIVMNEVLFTFVI